MIKRISVRNFKAFRNWSTLSLSAVPSERLQGNIAAVPGGPVYKSAAIFSGNNVGKTSFLEAVEIIRKMMAGGDIGRLVEPNIHSKSGLSEFKIEFSRLGEKHSYAFGYDGGEKSLVYETIDGKRHEGGTSRLKRRDALSTPFLDMGRHANVLFMDELKPRALDELSWLLLESLGLRIEPGSDDLVSLGTRRAAALVPYVTEALVEGHSLFIDEFDSGLSFSLTRAIVSLFNNIDNRSAQLVFASHDITLLDVERLFLVPQIKIIVKDGRDASIVSLEELVNEGEDPQALFLQGRLGGVNRSALSKFLVALAKKRMEKGNG